MDFWEKVKKDLQKGIREGITFVKEGAVVVKEKAEELTEEAKKQYRIFNLKTKVQKEITELGGRIYDLSSKTRNPMTDRKVKTIVSRINKLEAQIKKLEEAAKVPAKKTTSKRKSKA